MSQPANAPRPEQGTHATSPPAAGASGAQASGLSPGDSMVVHTRARELLAWLLPQVVKWPREQRHIVSRHVAELAMQVHDALVAARHLPPPARAAVLRDADILLDQLRQHLQLAWQWQWLSNGQFQHVSGLTGELGRLIGGWRKSGPTV